MSPKRDPQISRFAGEPPSPWEVRYGYSRRVDAGPFVLIGGTTAVSELGFVVGESPYEQAVEILHKLGTMLIDAGLDWSAAIQTRIYVTDISRADEVGRAFSEVFGGSDDRGSVSGAASGGGPICTMVEVSSLIDPRMLVEIELVAYRA